HANIVARGSVGQSGTLTIRGGSLPNVPLLAVETGQIRLVAGGSLSTAGVVNPAELHKQVRTFANPVDDNVNSALNTPLLMDTYGPNSAASLLAIAGDLNIRAAPVGPTAYPASFEAIALTGDITTNGLSGGANPGIVLSGSMHGTFQLL